MTHRANHHRPALAPHVDPGSSILDIDMERKPQTGQQRKQPHGNAEITAQSMEEILNRVDGWLRIIPDGEHKLLYCKWKFHRGPHTGFYVMSVVESYQIAYGLQLLAMKLQQVDMRALKPTKDKAFDDD